MSNFGLHCDAQVGPNNLDNKPHFIYCEKMFLHDCIDV